MTLKKKAVGAILILAFILTFAAVLVSYKVYSRTMDTHYKNMAMHVAKTTAIVVDAKQVETYTKAVTDIYLQTTSPQFEEEEEEAEYYAQYEYIFDDAYQELHEKLSEIKNANDVLSLYIIYVDAESKTCVYIIDADEGETACAAGTWDVIYEQNYEVLSHPENGFESYITNTDEFGWLCSAGAAIMNEDGEVVAHAMVDLSMDQVMMDRHLYLIRLCLILLSITVILLLFFIRIVNHSVVEPINHLAEAARSFVDDMERDDARQEQSSLDELNIRSGDEIEHLFHSIQFMRKEIYTYIENLSKITAEKERIGAELSVAAQIQANMLPSIFPAFPEREEFEIYATMNPAKEVGGDFYDFFMVDERHLAIVMADVSGKGVPAALFMVIGKTLIKEHTQPGRDLGEVFTEVNRLLCESNSEALFITAFEGVLDLVTGEFCFVNAGHEMPYICKKDSSFVPYKIRPGFVLAGMENMRYRAGSIQLDIGDKIFQYTDGVTEATNIQNEWYGNDRLKRILDANAKKTPVEILPAIKEDIDQFVGTASQFDDITMLCMEYKAQMIPGRKVER